LWAGFSLPIIIIGLAILFVTGGEIGCVVVELLVYFSIILVMHEMLGTLAVLIV